VRGCRLRLAQKLSSDSSGSIATSSAASRHRSAGLRRRPCSSKMRTSVRLRPSSAKTSSSAALALAGRSITSVTPVPEVTVNFMARSPNCIMDVGATTECSKGNPASKGVSTRGGRQCVCGSTTVPSINLSLLHGHRQSSQRLRSGTGCRYLEFRLSITFAWFRYSRRFFSSATTVSKVTAGTPFSKPRRLQAVPSLRLCPRSSLGSRHAACRQAFRLTGRQVRAVAPKRRPSAVRHSAAFSAGREAAVRGSMAA
jgi:hypothetical protein